MDVSELIPIVGLALTSILLIHQDFDNRLVHDLVFFPAVLFIGVYYGYEYYRLDTAFVLLPLFFAVVVISVLLLFRRKTKLNQGDMLALIVFSLFPSFFVQTVVISVVLVLLLLWTQGRLNRLVFSEKNLNVPFAGLLGCSFVLYVGVTLISVGLKI